MNIFLGICALVGAAGATALGDEWAQALAGVLFFLIAVFLFQGGSLPALVGQ